jgi:hypothetical protein
MDKTVKIREYSGDVKSAASRGNLTADQEKSLELVKKNARLEEENKKLLEHVKTIEQLRDSLKQEQAKTVEMANMAVGLEDKLKELDGLEAKIKKVAELEAKVKELTETLNKISNIAAAGQAD